jgi:hypothetical protein
MKFVLVIVIVFLGASSLPAQTARVIALTPADTTEVSDKYEALQRAQKDWDDLQLKIKEKYTIVSSDDKERGSSYSGWLIINSGAALSSGSFLIGGGDNHCETAEEKLARKKLEAKQEQDYKEYIKNMRYLRLGWEDGFEFTKDFKFIVPKTRAVEPCKGLGCVVWTTSSNN